LNLIEEKFNKYPQPILLEITINISEKMKNIWIIIIGDKVNAIGFLCKISFSRWWAFITSFKNKVIYNIKKYCGNKKKFY
jgi:hypothetical protein